MLGAHRRRSARRVLHAPPDDPGPRHHAARPRCALFDRAEPRDLDDVRALLERGGDLPRALADAGRVFSGLTAETLLTTLRALPLARLGPVVGWTPMATTAMIAIRDELLIRLGGRSDDPDT